MEVKKFKLIAVNDKVAPVDGVIVHQVGKGGQITLSSDVLGQTVFSVDTKEKIKDFGTFVACYMRRIDTDEFFLQVKIGRSKPVDILRFAPTIQNIVQVGTVFDPIYLDADKLKDTTFKTVDALGDEVELTYGDILSLGSAKKYVRTDSGKFADSKFMNSVLSRYMVADSNLKVVKNAFSQQRGKIVDLLSEHEEIAVIFNSSMSFDKVATIEDAKNHVEKQYTLTRYSPYIFIIKQSDFE